MRSSTLVKGGAVLAATAVIGLSAAPAQAAEHVSQASATAASITVAGSGTDSGTYTVTNDGNGPSASGNNRPLIRVLGGQRLVSTGTLAQDAVANVDGKKGYSVACSGIAGDGATVAAVGDGSCLTGGDTLSLDVASLDLSKLKVASTPLTDLDDQLQNALASFQLQLTTPLTALFKQALTAVGDPALHLDAGAIQSYCKANGSTTVAASQLAGAGAYVDIPTYGRVNLVSLPVNPAPNTHVVTKLDQVAVAIEKALKQQLTTLLTNNAAGADAATNVTKALDQVSQQLNAVLGQVSSQLTPLEQNVLDITLNKQTRGTGSIAVTALDARVLPVARQFTGSDLVHLTLGTSTCGPNGRITPVVKKALPTKPKAKAPAKHAVPTVVTAGLADAPRDGGSAGRTALVALLTLGAGGIGAGVYRRALRR